MSEPTAPADFGFNYWTAPTKDGRFAAWTRLSGATLLETGDSEAEALVALRARWALASAEA